LTSLSDKSAKDHYRISVRKDLGIDISDPQATAHPGYVSNVLHAEEHVGDIVQLSRPLGVFFLDPDRVSQAPVVLLSVGVGLTPLLSMLNTFA
jgi:nitric oxide dioxygenase